MNWFHRFLERLNPPLVIPAAANAGSATEICESEWRTVLETTRVSAYQAGLVQGEINGRLLLARELEAEFSGTPITEDDAHRIRQRQLH